MPPHYLEHDDESISIQQEESIFDSSPSRSNVSLSPSVKKSVTILHLQSQTSNLDDLVDELPSSSPPTASAAVENSSSSSPPIKKIRLSQENSSD